MSAPHGQASSGRLAGGLVAVGLIAVGALAWSLLLRPPLAVDARALGEMPGRLGSWSASEIPVEDGVAEMLAADSNLQREYRHPLGEVIWLYVGYYGTDRGGRPEHVPRTCYQAHGWEIAASRRLPIAGTEDLEVNELLVEREGEQRLVHFWYRSHARTGIVTDLELGAEHLLRRVRGERADGALVRLSTPLRNADDVLPARSRLAGFAASVDPLLARHWPTEAPASSGT